MVLARRRISFSIRQRACGARWSRNRIRLLPSRFLNTAPVRPATAARRGEQGHVVQRLLRMNDAIIGLLHLFEMHVQLVEQLRRGGNTSKLGAGILRASTSSSSRFVGRVCVWRSS